MTRWHELPAIPTTWPSTGVIEAFVNPFFGDVDLFVDRGLPSEVYYGADCISDNLPDQQGGVEQCVVPVDDRNWFGLYGYTVPAQYEMILRDYGLD
jgi:hypothetical protein